MKRFPNEEPATLNLIKRILNTLWIVLGLAALSLIFIPEDKYRIAVKNIELIVYVGFVLVFTIIAASSVETLFSRSIRKTIAEEGDPTSYKFLRYLSVFGVYFLGAILATLAFPPLRGIAQTALGGAGILAVVIGVASQEALANLIGGVFIISFKPFRVGDTVKITESLA
ncbi:hypothetical protein LCGC14_0755720 [marine sediment metagenome]|uniref:Mechanosensitive ion channel MscS domain-containing protein n=1 Tax=marine sediment metagenome TaxID=412755 RepID=A0A0F9SMV7_9ZZZZ|tara:strand:- start:637 stop:1146 length:510 start_codon:yes stop_codon:yes gene_type:complete